MLQLFPANRSLLRKMLKIVQSVSFIFVSLFIGGVSLVDAESFEALREQTFEAAWEQVGAAYYDGTFGGLDWDEVGERYRASLSKAKDMPAVRKLIRDMLYELGDSHLSLLAGSEEEESFTVPWVGGWSGVDLCFDEERVVFYRVDSSGPAYRAGIRDGDELISVDGRSLKRLSREMERTGLPAHILRYSVLSAALSHFRGTAGAELAVETRLPHGVRKSRAFTLDRFGGRTTEPFGNIGRLPLEFEAKVLDDGVGYLRFSLWFPAVMPDIREFIETLPDETPGLVIDLRGNPGGMMVMAGGLAGMILEEQASLGRTTLRSGFINVVGFPQRGRFAGKVALLVDEASVSTSEVFAIGLQELGRVRVFGQPTPGAALPSVITRLPNGDSLQVAMGDFRTPGGTSLEGRGVKPDVVVAVSPIDLSRGIDTVLLAARNWINQAN